MFEQLWVIGMGGIVVGGAFGTPLLRGAEHRHQRRLGALLLAAGTFATVAAARHGGLGVGPLEWLGAHLVDVIGLSAMPSLVLWAAHATEVLPLRRGATGLLRMPLGLYLGVAVARGGATLPFAWLLPVAVSFSLLTFDVWRRGRLARGSGDPAVRLVGGAVALAFTLNLAQALRTLWPDEIWLREAVPLTVLGGLVLLGARAIRTLVQPVAPVTAGATQGPAASGPSVDVGTGRVGDEGGPRYEKSALDDEKAAALLDTLDCAMRDRSLYLQPSLTLSGLAQAIDVTPHALSEALNRVRGTTLTTYLTALRVAAATRHLADPTNDRYTIDAIAEMSGFGSRSAFYKAFVAATGTTPTNHRGQLRLDSTSPAGGTDRRG